MSHPTPQLPPTNRLSIQDAQGEELLGPKDPNQDQVVIATDTQGNSLTLLEEYARRKKSRTSPAELALSLACATASLAFAALIYLNTH